MLACQKSCLGKPHLSAGLCEAAAQSAPGDATGPTAPGEAAAGVGAGAAAQSAAHDAGTKSTARTDRATASAAARCWASQMVGAKRITTTNEKTAKNDKIHRWKICQVWKNWEFFQVENPQRFEKLAPQGAAEKATADVWSRVGVNSESWKVRRVGSQCYRVPYFTRWWFPFFIFFLPLSGGNDPICRTYFSNGLKPPTSHRFHPYFTTLLFFLMIKDWWYNGILKIQVRNRGRWNWRILKKVYHPVDSKRLGI